MKKIKIAFIVAMSVVTLIGCGSQKAYEGDNTSESVQVDNSNDTVKTMAIDEKSAQQLVSERLDTTKYSVKKDDDINVDGKDYYIFHVYEGDTQIAMGVAVEKISGELYAYKEDKTIAPYSEFTLYDENTDAVVQWDGTFKNDNATLELLPADTNSFEFTLTSNDGKNTVTGAAQVSGKDATYEGEEGYSIAFTNVDNAITVTVSGTSQSATAFQGTYTK